MNLIKQIILSCILCITVSSLASASGGFSSGGGGSNYNRSYESAKKVDHVYEYGKSIYNGRHKDVGKIKTCMFEGEEKVKLRRALIKEYKETSYVELANALHHCDKDGLIANVMTKEQISYVLYYLNKRFKLKITK